jgi:hypothetical protein
MCADCGKGNAIVPIDPNTETVYGGGWLCPRCVIIRVHDPENMKYTQADIDLQDYLENGGRLS